MLAALGRMELVQSQDGDGRKSEETKSFIIPQESPQPALPFPVPTLTPVHRTNGSSFRQ